MTDAAACREGLYANLHRAPRKNTHAPTIPTRIFLSRSYLMAIICYAINMYMAKSDYNISQYDIYIILRPKKKCFIPFAPISIDMATYQVLF